MRTRARTVLLVLASAAAPLGAGCNLIKGGGDQNRPRGTGKLEEVTPQQLVTYLNDRAARLQSLEYNKVQLSAQQGLLPTPTISGFLACAQPRNFRLKAGQSTAMVDLGSNPEQFWVYAKVPTEDPLFVYATHQDFEAGQARLPGNLPFEPDWVMQAFGMKTFPLDQPGYKVRVDDRERAYVLAWPARAPNGRQITKEIVFDGDSATGTRPQVKRHVVKDAGTGKVIASAEVRTAQTVQVGADPATGLPLAVQYPTRAVLRWEEQKFEMDLTMDRATVNQPIADDARRLFARPAIGNAQALNLAEYRFK